MLTCRGPVNLQVKKGFTLIEILVATTLIAVLFSLSLSYYNRFNRSQTLSQAINNLKSDIRLAQDKALAGEKPTQCLAVTLVGYKVKFVNNSTYQMTVLCDGSEYSVSGKESISLPTGVAKSAGASEVFFRVLGYGVDQAITFTLSYQGVGQKTISVSKTGEVSDY